MIFAKEFRSLMEEYQILSASEADNIFRMMLETATLGVGFGKTCGAASG